MVRVLVGTIIVAMAFGSGRVFCTRALGVVATSATAPYQQVLPPPPCPILPENGDTVFSVSPVLKVESPVPSGWFHFRVTENKSVVTEGYSILPQWNVSAGGRILQRGHRYHWSCRVRGVSGWSSWFTPWSFTVGFELPPPEPKLPQDGARVFTSRPLLLVKPVPEPARYRFRVLEGKTLMGEGVTDYPFWVYSGKPLQRNDQYQWICRIEKDTDTSGWFEPMWSFEVADVSARDGEVLSSTNSVPVSVSAEPNPFSERVAINLAPVFGEVVRLEVYSTEGRVVRSLASELCPARNSLFVWDGRDQNDRVVGPGNYFCLIRGKSWRKILKLTKVN